MKLSHMSENNHPVMVDVGDKEKSDRVAIAEGFVKLNAETIELIRGDRLKKGNVLVTAELAGIHAAKKCSDLIPLCHNIPLTNVKVVCEITDDGVVARGEARCVERTGVEMEALTAVSIALLTVYDMCKAVDESMEISEVRLVSKTKTPLS